MSIDHMGVPPVYRLKPYDVVVKRLRSTTAHKVHTMQHVQQHTSIPVPWQVRRVIAHESGKGAWLVMDYIDEDCLLAVAAARLVASFADYLYVAFISAAATSSSSPFPKRSRSI